MSSGINSNEAPPECKRARLVQDAQEIILPDQNDQLAQLAKFFDNIRASNEKISRMEVAAKTAESKEAVSSNQYKLSPGARLSLISFQMNLVQCLPPNVLKLINQADIEKLFHITEKAKEFRDAKTEFNKDFDTIASKVMNHSPLQPGSCTNSEWETLQPMVRSLIPKRVAMTNVELALDESLRQSQPIISVLIEEAQKMDIKILVSEIVSIVVENEMTELYNSMVEKEKERETTFKIRLQEIFHPH